MERVQGVLEIILTLSNTTKELIDGIPTFGRLLERPRLRYSDPPQSVMLATRFEWCSSQPRINTGAYR